MSANTTLNSYLDSFVFFHKYICFSSIITFQYHAVNCIVQEANLAVAWYPIHHAIYYCCLKRWQRGIVGHTLDGTPTVDSARFCDQCNASWTFGIWCIALGQHQTRSQLPSVKASSHVVHAHRFLLSHLMPQKEDSSH